MHLKAFVSGRTAEYPGITQIQMHQDRGRHIFLSIY